MIKYLCWLAKKYDVYKPAYPREYIEVSMNQADPDKKGDIIYNGPKEWIPKFQEVLLAIPGEYGLSGLEAKPTPRNLAHVMESVGLKLCKIEAVAICGEEMFFPEEKALNNYTEMLAKNIWKILVIYFPQILDAKDGLEFQYGFQFVSAEAIVFRKRLLALEDIGLLEKISVQKLKELVVSGGGSNGKSVQDMENIRGRLKNEIILKYPFEQITGSSDIDGQFFELLFRLVKDEWETSSDFFSSILSIWRS